jgi:two-component system, LuxR family, sensor kinase FixL
MNHRHLASNSQTTQANMFARLLHGTRRAVLLKAGILIAGIALVDWRVIGEIPLGFLYLIPMLMVGSVEGWTGIILAAILCTCLAERFSDLAWSFRTGTSRDVLYFAAFFGAGLFIREVDRSRKVAAENLHQIERERDARRGAEEQLEILIESSPVAIVTADASGNVLMANGAAHRMLGVAQGDLPGKQIHKYLPALTNVISEDASMQLIRAVMQARGLREDGDAFLADICFSTYRTSAGIRLAAMVLDISEEIRAHEVAGLQQLLDGSRIAISALSHEIRNVCGAIAVVHRNLKRAQLLAGNKDFEALGSLVDALEKVASVNVQQSPSQAGEIDLSVLLDELRIVVAPAIDENGIQLEWTVEPGLPQVWADRSSLMQVFLNLVANSVRALEKKKRRVLCVAARREGPNVVVEVADNAGGVAHPEHLFRPFQAGAESTGLGLYLSRAFMRSFGGELRYVAVSDGACFIVELLRAQEGTAKETLWMKSAS